MSPLTSDGVYPLLMTGSSEWLIRGQLHSSVVVAAAAAVVVAAARGCTGEFSTKKMFSKLFFSQCNAVGMVCMMNTHQKNF